MVQFTTKLASIASVFLLTAAPTVATTGPRYRNFARQDPSTCALDSLLGRVAPSSGGRKVGLVIDASNSMADNDPDNLRLVAAKSLNNALISQAEATGGKSADQITVVDFAYDASVLYPLGDPSGADSIIDSISLHGGTAIGSGLQAAIDELTATGSSPVTNSSGVIVFTDGQDSDPVLGTNLTITATQRAASLGIRVSFGFLTATSEDQDVEILRAILESGGVYATIDQASTQSAFVALVLANGMTAKDNNGSNATSTLLPGISTAKFLQTGTNTFTYGAQAGEAFNVTVKALDPIALKITLKDPSANEEIASNETDNIGVAVVQYTAQSAMNVEVSVTAMNQSTGIFSVGVGSSISLNSTCNATFSPTTTPPATFTGGAKALGARSVSLVAGFLIVSIFSITL